jgi:L-alanine-DL-glutamate epimerase-like enolase superfamily enzyme
MRSLTARAESWPLIEPFVISRLTQTMAELAVVEIAEDGHIGRGESERADAFDAGAPKALEEIEAVRAAIEAGIGREALLEAMPAGAGRSALDAALWDLEAKRAGRRAWELAGLAPPAPIETAYTIGLNDPEAMAAAAARHAARPLLKLKLGGAGDLERVAAVRAAAPEARLIADANQAWDGEILEPYLNGLAEAGVELLEQPLPPDTEHLLAELERPLAVCADESFSDRASLAALAGRYDCVNIKLDKAGGLTESLALAGAARAAGLGVMVGCMVGTSLSMAPALLVAGLADFVDLDGPLLLAEDRSPGLTYRGSQIDPAPPELWG